MGPIHDTGQGAAQVNRTAGVVPSRAGIVKTGLAPASEAFFHSAGAMT